MLTKPKMTKELLSQIRLVIQENPDWGRARISTHLCELWDWRIPGGTLKDISCRRMLCALDKAGSIQLPASKNASKKSTRRIIKHIEHDAEPIICELGDLRPLSIEIVGSGYALEEFKSLLDQYHYLGYDRTIGENMKYVIRSRNGTVLACLLFGSAAWKCRDRDAYIGWSHEQRASRLYKLANNVRFLIPEWVRVPCLASHALSLISRRLSSDWEIKYGHPILALETFVDGRFRGTCYRAANWTRVGRTCGRGRNDRKHECAVSEKEIYLLPLARRWREDLLAE